MVLGQDSGVDGRTCRHGMREAQKPTDWDGTGGASMELSFHTCASGGGVRVQACMCLRRCVCVPPGRCACAGQGVCVQASPSSVSPQKGPGNTGVLRAMSTF